MSMACLPRSFRKQGI